MESRSNDANAIAVPAAHIGVGDRVTAQAQRRNATLTINGGTLIDGTGAPPVAGATVVVSGNRIAEAGPSSKITVPKNTKTIDARGKWIIPGLIDAHVHFFQSGDLYTRPDVIDLRQRVPYERELAWIRGRLPYTFTRYLCSGITSIVDAGGPFANFNVRATARRTRAAPRVAVAGPLISTVPPDDLETADPAIIEVTNPEQAVALVRRELARKPDLIKIWFIRGPDVELERAVRIVEAVVQVSHAADVRVAVHATELETAKAAVGAGSDILVHSVSDRSVDDEFVQMVKERGVIYTTTIVVDEGYAEVLGQNVDLTDIERSCGDAQVIASWADLAKIPEDQLPLYARFPPRFTEKAIVLANLKRMQEAGAIVAAGTDAGNIGTLHGPSLHREFELMAEAGLTPMQIIVDATRNAARVFSPDPQIGTIESGKLADLVILDADPLVDIGNARQINKVIKGGHVFEVSKLKSQQVRDSHHDFGTEMRRELITLDARSGKVLRRNPLSGSPDVVFFDRVHKHLYVAAGNPGTIDVFDTKSMEKLGTVATEKGAHTFVLVTAGDGILRFYRRVTGPPS